MVMGKVDQKATGGFKAQARSLSRLREEFLCRTVGSQQHEKLICHARRMDVGTYMWHCQKLWSLSMQSLWDGAWPPSSHDGVAGPGTAERMEFVNLARILKRDLLTGVEVTSILGISIIVVNLKTGQKRRWDTAHFQI